ncbi:MAG: carbamoyltransferase HypF [Sedimenticola sp.]|nr:carbamoyltransferase HypF [Sedimenticola sp.]
MNSEQEYAESIRIRGLVQGVGFRPTVWRLANRCQLTGQVWNDAEGVLIEVAGPKAAIDQLVQLLQIEPPPLSTIDAIEREPCATPPAGPGFSIVESQGGRVQTGIVPDAATCDACLADIRDPANRRYRYPFTNCTHCGPRLSIVHAIPYDRATTSMAAFEQCPDCLSEYRDPGDRRFHAQPNACPVCGPRVWLESREGPLSDLADEDVVSRAATLIRSGAIVAIKGIGGIHLACDAANESAVATLRRRKQRYHKAFALMARDLRMIRRHARLSEQEARLLSSVAAPIVVLDRLESCDLASRVAPGQTTLGFMLPYTPLHHLLMGLLDRPVVLTSGNRSDEPQVIGNDEARRRLGEIADYWLLHDREIVNRLDDSVLRVMNGSGRLLRRARGYAPAPILLHPDFRSLPSVLAMGGELKNTFCLLQEGRAVLSQHLGDLENVATLTEYRNTLALYQRLFQHQPVLLTVDYHPDYLSTQWGERAAAEQGLQLQRVQHHHAHIAACMAEHGMPPDQPPLLGIALDGLGMGENGELWGGEFFRVDFVDAEHLGGFLPVAMPGGAKAMYEPWRNTLAHLMAAFDWQPLLNSYADLEPIQALREKPLENLLQMLERGLNSPAASSCGRLFDAVAAAIGICREKVTHEGQAAIELEAILVRKEWSALDYGCDRDWRDGRLVLSWKPLWSALLRDLEQSLPAAEISARFHHGLARSLCQAAQLLCERDGLERVVLSGGVFQNRTLLEGVSRELSSQGLEVLSPLQTPANDGGLSLGQAVIALARYRAGRQSD